MSETIRRALAVINKQLPSRVHHEGLQGAGEGAAVGKCHPSSEETIAKILLLLWAASPGGYPQPVARPRLGLHRQHPDLTRFAQVELDKGRGAFVTDRARAGGTCWGTNGRCHHLVASTWH